MGALPEDQGVLGLVLFLLSGGGGVFLYGIYKDWRSRRDSKPSSAKLHEAQIDASMYAVVRSRDEIQEDLQASRSENARLHAIIVDVQDRAAKREADLQEQATQRETQLRKEIEHLESKLRAMLDELQNLKHRHGMHDPGV